MGASGGVDEQLAELAAAHGVATWYLDGARHRVDVDPAVVVAVLGQLGVDASTPLAVRQELARVRERRARYPLPATVALRQGESRPLPGPALVRCEDGTQRELRDELPSDLPLGWHRLVTADQEVTLVVSPRRLPAPPRTWGWALQLYALCSRASWGMGDLADLGEFVRWTAGAHGAGVVLLNPLHAVTPVPPIQPSPYSPSSRRFVNPLYLRVEHTPAYRRADPAIREQVDALRVPLGDRIDHDTVWAAKRAALELLWPYAESVDVDADPALRDFATFCALAERHGADWRRWPEPLRHPASAAVAAARVELAPRVAFHAWVQRLCAEQLDEVRRRARAAGMPVGVVHDLAVGVAPDGADAWALQDVLATEVTVGAPPDAFNQQGQDWNLPPWRPDRLAEAGYRPYREMLRAVLRHADGLRVDHVAGLWRLWWIPPGEPPSRGTYVHYDAEVLLGALALEAYRAGAVVVGEDLGTVEPEVTAALHERNMLGSAVLWFQRDHDAPGAPPLPPERWPEQAVASISTHDLPTAPGFLRGEHVTVRAELGVLIRSVDEELARAEAERRDLMGLLRAQGLVRKDESDPRALVRAMHALLARTPSRLVLVSPYDVVGEVRQPNLPGTIDEYPNWRLPLRVLLEELVADPHLDELLEPLRTARAAVGGPVSRCSAGSGCPFPFFR
ncbi:MAG TPA: 4-alpha-glucanotransferase [Pseudonocardiaceae bacterium]